MPQPARPLRPPPPPPTRPRGGAAEQARLLRFLENRRQTTSPLAGPAQQGPFAGYYPRATYSSFRMEGVPLDAADFAAALTRGAAARSCRTRCAQRLRNHVAVLYHLELLLRRRQPLESGSVIRWYTSIACGLSAGTIDAHALRRIEQIVAAVSSPQLRLVRAVKEVASVHVRLLADPFVPGFNGILARLLLRYHLGRCGLPPVLLDPERDPPLLRDEATFFLRLLEMLRASYESMAAPAVRGTVAIGAEGFEPPTKGL